MTSDVALRSGGRQTDMARSDLLAGLVASRLCHDLVGPVGAIANGVDLIDEIGAPPGPEELALVRQSTERAAALLRALRCAFGQSSSEGVDVVRTALDAELRAVIDGRRVSFSVVALHGPALPAPMARLCALMVFSGRLLLGLSGRIELSLTESAALPVRMMAEGPRAGIEPEAAAWLSGDLSSPPSSREVELALLPGAAAMAGARLDFSAEDGRVVVVALADTA